MAHTFANRKPAGFVSNVYCSAAHSPLVACAGKKIQKSEYFHDKTEHYWCAAHAIRGRLLNWAKEHGYPGIAFVSPAGMKCAIGYPGAKVANNEVMWTLAIIQTSDEVVDAAARHVGLTTVVEDD